MIEYGGSRDSKGLLFPRKSRCVIGENQITLVLTSEDALTQQLLTVYNLFLQLTPPIIFSKPKQPLLSSIYHQFISSLFSEKYVELKEMSPTTKVKYCALPPDVRKELQETLRYSSFVTLEIVCRGVQASSNLTH